jgi:hypothetical protein
MPANIVRRPDTPDIPGNIPKASAPAIVADAHG